MRALCGAIIAAGALIGVGLTALGIGQRYSTEPAFQRTVKAGEGAEPPKSTDEEVKPVLVKMWWMDRPLIFSLMFTTCMAVIGLGIAIAGLAYHHVRREREHTVHREAAAARPTT